MWRVTSSYRRLPQQLLDRCLLWQTALCVSEPLSVKHKHDTTGELSQAKLSDYGAVSYEFRISFTSRLRIYNNNFRNTNRSPGIIWCARWTHLKQKNETGMLQTSNVEQNFICAWITEYKKTRPITQKLDKKLTFYKNSKFALLINCYNIFNFTQLFWNFHFFK